MLSTREVATPMINKFPKIPSETTALYINNFKILDLKISYNTFCNVTGSA